MRAPMTKRTCPKCGRTISDRGSEKCPNLRNHIAAHDKPKKEPAPRLPRLPRNSTGPWWYSYRTKHGRWAFNHRGKRYFAPIDMGPDDRMAAALWHAQTMREIDPGWTGPKPVRTTRQGHRRFHVALSRESVALLDHMVAAQVAPDHTAVFRLAVADLPRNLDVRGDFPAEHLTVRKAFNLLPGDLEMAQSLALRWNTTYSQIAEFAVRRLAERVSQNGLEAVREVEAEEPVAEGTQ